MKNVVCTCGGYIINPDGKSDKKIIENAGLIYACLGLYKSYTFGKQYYEYYQHCDYQYRADHVAELYKKQNGK